MYGGLCSKKLGFSAETEFLTATMARFNPDVNSRPEPGQPDGISCVGVALLVVFVLVMLGVAAERSTPAIATSQTAAPGSPQRVAQPTLPIPTNPPPSPTWTATPSPQPPTPTPQPPTPSPQPLPPTPFVPEQVVFPTVSPPPPLPPPQPTPSGTFSITVRVPILMYHYVSSPPADADQYRLDLSVEPAAFREQMAYLAANGYTAIDLYDLSLAITGKQTLPPRPIILTFDDGYRDVYENAFPILKEYGLEATFFIVTDFIDQGHPAYLTWPMVEEMAAAGMRMEPHSKNHVDLYGKEHDLVVYQVLGSLQTVEAHVGYRPRYFAYPGGTYDDQTIEVLQALDFWGAVVTAGGKWHGFKDRYEWTRLRMRHTTTLPVFVALVEGQE